MIIPKHTLVKSISDAYLQCVQRHGQLEWKYVLDTALKAIDQNAQGTTGTAVENGCVQYTPVSMLTTFKKHYIAGEPTLNFDYLGFHEVCAKALRKMYLSFLDHCRSPEVANARQDAEFVESILWNSADSITTSTVPGETLLGRAASMINEVIPECGNKVLQEGILQVQWPHPTGPEASHCFQQ